MTRVESRRPGFVRGAGAGAALALLALALGAAPKARSPRHVPPGELTNPSLRPALAQWLVGPISWLLDQGEIDAYLLLATDAEAEGSIARFWAEHGGIRERFDERVARADKQYREATYAGHRSDRGIVYVLYGEPEQVTYEEHRDILDPAVELWRYPKDAPSGLDGRPPLRNYRFTREGDTTAFYTQDARRDAMRRLDNGQQTPSGPPPVGPP